MDHLDREGVTLEPSAELDGDGDAAVLTPGAADRECQVALSLALVAAADQVDQLHVPVQEFRRTLLREHIVGDVLVEAGVVAQLRDPAVSYTHLRAHET